MIKILLTILFLCLPIVALADSKTIGGVLGPTGGATTWTGLTDTPGSIITLQCVRGNSGATALEFVDCAILTDGKLGVGTTLPKSSIHIKANTPGSVGNSFAGQLIIQTLVDDVNSNVVITGYESNLSGNPDQQLWYIGSTSGSNQDIAIINRRFGRLFFSTNNLERVGIAENGNVELVNFTKLGSGSPNIKFKKLTGTTGATEGSTINIAHGLTAAKIIGFDVLVNANNNLIPMAFVDVAEFEFNAFIDPTNVKVNLSSTNSANLLSNTVTVLLTYEE